MRFIAFLIFIAVPLAELALLIKVGELIGVLPTVLLVILTAVIGVTLLRIQGLTVLKNARAAMDAGRPPIDSVVDGVLLLVAGAFLLTPGLLTDSVGFLLLVPQVRHEIGRTVFAKLMGLGSFMGGGVGPGPGGGRTRPAGERPGGKGPTTIEGEYHRVGEGDEPSDAPARDGRAKDGLKASDDERPPGGKGSPWRQ